MSFTNRLRKYALLWLACAILLAGCAPANALASSAPVSPNNAVNTATPASVLATATITPEPEGCIVIHAVTLCVQDIQRSETDTQVKLKVLGDANLTYVDILDDSENGKTRELLDEQGRTYSLVGNDGLGYDDAKNAYYQFSFQAIPVDVKKLTLSLPVVQIDSQSPVGAKPLGEGFQLDLGPNPQPGQTKDLDITTSIEGQTFHFVRAEFQGDGVSWLRVTVYADSLNLPNDIAAIIPMFEDREKGVSFGSKWGTNGKSFQIFADLVIPPGKSSGLTQNTYVKGVLNLNVYQISHAYRGPFNLKYTLP